MLKEMPRREFLRYALGYVAAMALPSCREKEKGLESSVYKVMIKRNKELVRDIEGKKESLQRLFKEITLPGLEPVFQKEYYGLERLTKDLEQDIDLLYNNKYGVSYPIRGNCMLQFDHQGFLFELEVIPDSRFKKVLSVQYYVEDRDNYTYHFSGNAEGDYIINHSSKNGSRLTLECPRANELDLIGLRETLVKELNKQSQMKEILEYTKERQKYKRIS